MNSQEQFQDSNRVENNYNSTDELHYYLSQRAEYLCRADSEKQNEVSGKEYIIKQKELLEITSNECLQLEMENLSMQDTLNEKRGKQQHLVDLLFSTQEVMNGYIENFNQEWNLFQLNLNYQEKIPVMEQEMLAQLETFKKKTNNKEQEYIKRLNKMKEQLDHYKNDHLKKIEYVNNLNDKIFEDNKKEETTLLDLRQKITDINVKRQKKNEENNAVETKFNDLSINFTELQKTLENLVEQKDIEESIFEKKIFDLEAESFNRNKKFSYLQIELEDIKQRLKLKKEDLTMLKNEKNTQESLFNFETKITNMKKDKINLEQKFQENLKEINEEKNILQKQFVDLGENRKILEKNMQISKMNYLEIEDEGNNLRNQIDKINSNLAKYETDLNQREILSNEQSVKFESEITTLKKFLEDEMQTQNIEVKLKLDLEEQLKELNEYHTAIISQQEKTALEVQEEEVITNISNDSVKDEIIKENTKIHELKKEYLKYETEETKKIANLKSKFEKEMIKQHNKIDEIKIKIEKENQNKKQIKLDDLKKQQEQIKTLELQVSEIKASNESLQNEMNSKIRENKLLEQELNELDKKTTEISKAKPNLKRAKYDHHIPKINLPKAKYTSSSDCTLDEMPLKTRKIALKRRITDKKKDYITEALKTENRSRPKKSIKKAVY